MPRSQINAIVSHFTSSCETIGLSISGVHQSETCLNDASVHLWRFEYQLQRMCLDQLSPRGCASTKYRLEAVSRPIIALGCLGRLSPCRALSAECHEGGSRLQRVTDHNATTSQLEGRGPKLLREVAELTLRTICSPKDGGTNPFITCVRGTYAHVPCT